MIEPQEQAILSTTEQTLAVTIMEVVTLPTIDGKEQYSIIMIVDEELDR